MACLSYPARKSGLRPGAIGLALLLALAWAAPGRSQTSVEITAAPSPAPYTAAQLDQLLGPIALYPDPLVGLILPAATAPGDLVSAASYVGAQADPYGAGAQPWSESVKALVHYPEIVEWMAQNLTWVQAVGAAFAAEPADVLLSIQRLRTQAFRLGTLGTTPQQEVVMEDDLIEILPVDSEVIYVPRYDASVVYQEGLEVDGASFLSFGTPYHTGDWLNYGFDWRRRALFVGRFSRDGQGWRRPNFFSQDVHVWHAPARASFPPAPAARPGVPLARPSLLPGVPPIRPSARERWESLAQRPGPNQAGVPAGQRPIFPGSAAPGQPFNPAAAQWQREREMRVREAQQRAAAHPGASPPPASPAHPSPPPPRRPPPSPAPANGDQRDEDKH
jgi:Protein of unknown function (DUF3300)